MEKRSVKTFDQYIYKVASNIARYTTLPYISQESKGGYRRRINTSYLDLVEPISNTQELNRRMKGCSKFQIRNAEHDHVYLHASVFG